MSITELKDVKQVRKNRKKSLARSDETRKRLGIQNPFSWTFGPLQTSSGRSGPPLKRA